MVSELIRVGLGGAYLMALLMNNRSRVKVAKRRQAKISNSGERFVPCPIKKYQSFYLVGDWGTIKKVDGKILTQSHNYGKAIVNIRNSKQATTFTVERLVALAYLKRPAKGDELTHKIVHVNGDVDDNRAVNLMWR